MPAITKEAALAYHQLNNEPGKLLIQPSKPLETQDDLGLAYTPGVADPVLEIDRDPNLAYDYPNQINNLLGIPYIFRGALDVRAREINDEMKITASHALAALAKEAVPPDVLKVYHLDHLEFGRDYGVPKPMGKRVRLWEAPAVARAAIQSGAARLSIDLEMYSSALDLRISKGLSRIYA
jgi:malic enzyme